MRRFKTLLLVLPMALMLSTCAAPAYALTDGAEGTPPTETQPVETQPVEAPPSETPPTETLPVETQPVETPPVETPPTETPPVETAPTETPPVETPPAETPPTETIGQPGEIDLGDISQLGEIFPPEVWSELFKALLEGGTAQDCECCTCQDRPHTCVNCDCCDCDCENCSKPVESAPVETPPATTTPKPAATTTPKPATTITSKPTQTTEPKPAETEPEKTPGQPLTPEGNLNLEDDIDGEAAEDKQFIVVQSRNGHYFYIIVDRAEDGENTVHFLNQVDEADLLALIEEEDTAPAVCTCTEKCAPGAVNTTCEICAVNMGECAGKEPEPEETDPPEEPEEPETPEKPEKKSVTGPLLIVLVLAVAGVGAVAYLKLFKKKAPDIRGTANLDDYDYGEDDEDESEDEDE